MQVWQKSFPYFLFCYCFGTPRAIWYHRTERRAVFINTVTRMLVNNTPTDKQTNQPTNKQTNKHTHTSLLSRNPYEHHWRICNQLSPSFPVLHSPLGVGELQPCYVHSLILSSHLLNYPVCLFFSPLWTHTANKQNKSSSHPQSIPCRRLRQRAIACCHPVRAATTTHTYSLSSSHSTRMFICMGRRL